MKKTETIKFGGMSVAADGTVTKWSGTRTQEAGRLKRDLSALLDALPSGPPATIMMSPEVLRMLREGK